MPVRMKLNLASLPKLFSFTAILLKDTTHGDCPAPNVPPVYWGYEIF